jgi:hypothetical protein
LSNYPIQTKFCEEMRPHIEKYHGEKEKYIEGLFDSIAECLGEYEHGSADIEDCFEDIFPFDRDADDWPEQRRRMLEQYAVIAQDVMLCWLYSPDDDIQTGEQDDD